jgi:hypothetical protein
MLAACAAMSGSLLTSVKTTPNLAARDINLDQ